jgi:flagellar motor switch protein FliM
MGERDVLPADEIAALVDAAKTGDLPSAASDTRSKRRRRVREIDFSRPTKFTQEQQRRLERAHDNFCRLAATRLSAELRLPIELQVIGIDQLTWSTAIADIPEPSISVVVQTKPLDTQVLMSVEQSLVMRLIDRLLGGPGTARHRATGLTEIEQTLARKLFYTLLDQLSVTWQEVAGLSLELHDSLEAKATTVHLAPPSEPTLRLTLELKLDRHSSTMSLTIPYRAIEPIAGRLAGGQFGDKAPDGATRLAAHRAVSGIQVELTGEVAGVELALDEVLALEAGSVVPLGRATDCTLYVGAVPIYRVRPGRNGSRRAIEIVGRVEAGR